jgi:hypothetical protein
MSYCTWASDRSRSDLYCFVDGTGWRTLVASSRLDQHAHTSDIHPRAVPIGLAFDGESFTDMTLAAFKARVESLALAGYRVPDYVLKTIELELAESPT